MNSQEFIRKLKAIVQQRTIYMWGTFGAPVTESLIAGKTRQYPAWYSASKQRELRALIGRGYFAFDCIGLIKAILWGWNGSNKTAHGGAVYQSNGMRDVTADTYIRQCKNVSSNFGTIEAGEVVWLPGHIGVYIGDGEVIEATPSWANGVQITKLSARRWQRHGYMPQVEYTKEQSLEAIEVMETSENLHLRAGASTSYRSLMVIPKGSEVQVYSKANGWAKVSYRGTMGHSSLSFLKSVDSRKGGKVIASALNVRSGPGTQYRIQGTLKLNDAVEILETVNGWHKIRYGTSTSYVSGDWIEESKEANSKEQKGKVTATIGLNIRQAPGGRVVGAYIHNEEIKILGREGSWYKTDKGFVSANYVKLI